MFPTPSAPPLLPAPSAPPISLMVSAAAPTAITAVTPTTTVTALTTTTTAPTALITVPVYDDIPEAFTPHEEERIEPISTAHQTYATEVNEEPSNTVSTSAILVEDDTDHQIALQFVMTREDLEKERIEQERLERERIERERIEQERLERERIFRESCKQRHIEHERNVREYNERKEQMIRLELLYRCMDSAIHWYFEYFVGQNLSFFDPDEVDTTDVVGLTDIESYSLRCRLFNGDGNEYERYIDNIVGGITLNNEPLIRTNEDTEDLFSVRLEIAIKKIVMLKNPNSRFLSFRIWNIFRKHKNILNEIKSDLYSSSDIQDSYDEYHHTYIYYCQSKYSNSRRYKGKYYYMNKYRQIGATWYRNVHNDLVALLF